MLRPVRRRLAALAMVLLLPTLGACGFGYQTNQVYQPAVGVNDRADDVNILGAVVVSGSDGAGTFVATFVNINSSEPAKLTSISGADDLTINIVKPVEIAPEELVNLAPLGAIGVSGESIAAGGFARLTLEFDTGQKTMLNVPIVDKDEEFGDIRAAIPSSSPSPSPSSSPSSSPSASPSPSPGSSSSPSPAP